MLSQRFINRLLTLAILSICSSVVNASGNSVPVVSGILENNNGDTMNQNTLHDFKNNNMNNSNNNSDTSCDSNKNSPRSTEHNEFNNKMNNIVHYEPDKMWFDYQALFDKRKSILLKKDDNIDDIEIKHIDFMENDLARDAVFGTDGDYAFNYNESFLDEILNCNAYAYCFVLRNCFKQLQKMRDIDNSNVNEVKQLELNYSYFLALIISSSKQCSDKRMSEYKKLSNGYIPKSIKCKEIDIDKINLLEIVNPLLNKSNNISVKN